MLIPKSMVRTLRTALTGAVVGTLLWPMAARAGELRLHHESVRFSELDGSATDLDGVADGTLTLDRLELGGKAEIVVDRATARFMVAGDVEISGTSTIRPVNDLQAQGPQIEVRAESIRLHGTARLRADGANAGGRLRLCAVGEIEIRGNTEVSANALDGTGPGGFVHMEAGQRLSLGDAATAVRANGGSGGSIMLVSCATDGSGRAPGDAAIAIHGRIEAIGTTGPGGLVEVEARQGGVAFQPTLIAIDASGATTSGGVSVTAATGVTPQEAPTRPAATVVAGAPSEAPCDCSDNTAVGGLVIAADVDRTTGVPGTLFKLSGRVVQATSPVEQWHWMLSDGREFTGPTVSVSFVTPGLYSAHLMATDQEGTVVHAETGVMVFDPTTQAPPELGLPVQVGDIDGDGTITLKDAHRVAKHAGRLERLADAAVPAGDVDLDGEVTPGDALLLGQAVAAGEPLPTVLLPDHGAPGARVNLISPDLLDPTAIIEIQVGEAAWIQQPLRPARGYATFVIPFDATQRGTMRGTPGPVEVQIRSNGVVVDTLTFEVEALPPLPANPKAELQALFDDYLALLELNQAVIQQLLDLAVVDGEQKELLLAAFSVAEEDAAAKMANLRALLDQPGGEELARLFFLFANANGYPEYRQLLTDFLATDAVALRATLQAMAGTDAPSVDEILNALCAAKKASDLLDTGGDILGWGCDALLVAAIIAAVVPADGPVVDAALLFTWASGCGAVEAGLEMVLLINSLVGSIEPDLRFEASPTSPRQGETVKLRAQIELTGIDDLCGFAVGQGRDELIEDLAEEAIERLLRKKLALRALSKAVELLSEELLEELEDRLEAAVVRAVGDTEVASALEELANKVCGLLNLGVPLLDDLSRIMQGPNPNVGTLTFVGDGTANYTCPDGSSSTADSVTFTATRDLCGEMAQKQVTVHCESRPVTITMGDNGSANDDIYEVRIQGVTVLTSSVPVRSISTTVNLPVGDHMVEMIGRAAPDGIGTYFIRFSGATVIGGAPLSGTDLTPGVVKTFIIRVQ